LLGEELIDLFRGTADEVVGVHHGIEVDGAEGRIGAESVDQVVAPALFFDHRPGGLAVTADRLVQCLPITPAATAAIKMFSVAIIGSSASSAAAITRG